MSPKALILLLLLLLPMRICAQQKILFFQTDWGNTLSIDAFLAKAKAAGYDGVELWMPAGEDKKNSLKVFSQSLYLSTYLLMTSDSCLVQIKNTVY